MMSAAGDRLLLQHQEEQTEGQTYPQKVRPRSEAACSVLGEEESPIHIIPGVTRITWALSGVEGEDDAGIEDPGLIYAEQWRGQTANLSPPPSAHLAIFLPRPANGSTESRLSSQGSPLFMLADALLGIFFFFFYTNKNNFSHCLQRSLPECNVWRHMMGLEADMTCSPHLCVYKQHRYPHFLTRPFFVIRRWVTLTDNCAVTLYINKFMSFCFFPHRNRAFFWWHLIFFALYKQKDRQFKKKIYIYIFLTIKHIQ
ncbi:unnamed protein product [Staurois parvus]|uniref:Uncharacterized protein n=1 Tax=Staurois parvus TaxID=386267 RepID=A0ABN9GHL1_9NEOB|nr:unnamed protein product [Staurois parvus]